MSTLCQALGSDQPDVRVVADSRRLRASRRPAFLAPLCPGNLPECANGRLRTNRPLLELSPLRPKANRACNRARDSSGVFLNPNSCKGFEPEPSKEGSG